MAESYKLETPRRENIFTSEMLLILNIKSLEDHRIEHDLCFLHRLLNGRINSPKLLELFNFGMNEPIAIRLRTSNTYHRRVDIEFLCLKIN